LILVRVYEFSYAEKLNSFSNHLKTPVMKKNMGIVDRTVRSLIAVVIISLSFSGIIHGPLGIALLAISVVFLLTSLFAFCPLYKLFGIHTCKSI